jgi:hypothetical protein
MREFRELHGLEAAAVLSEIRTTPEQESGDAGNHPQVHRLKSFDRVGLLPQNGGMQLGHVVVLTAI